MKRIITLATTFLLITGVASVSASNLTEAYFSGKNPQLTQQEREAIALAKKWQANSAQGIKPVAGTDGSIRFLFGA
ncbi:MAG: P-type conjugative transfer protein TrbG, partial [Nitrosomonas sp.]|nr:P-type conjugative transfer protein TrbG [Nitrosomonas sp.]